MSTNPLLWLAAHAARALPAGLKQRLYRLGPLTDIIRGGLNRVAPSGLSEVQVAAGALAGLTLQLDLQREKDYWLGTYESNLQTAIDHFARPGMLAYDCGANAGYIALILGRAVGPEGRVVAFEPLPANHSRLRMHLERHAGLTQFDFEPQAITAHTGEVQFLVHASGAMGKASGSAGRKTAYAETITVPGIALDDYVYAREQQPPDLIKMDIEGGEVLALSGMARLLIEARPILLLELHGAESARAAWRHLCEAGYSIHRLGAGYPQVQDVSELDWKAYLVALPPDA